MVLIDTNNRPIGNVTEKAKKEAATKTVEDTILRTLTIVETSYRRELPELCATLSEMNKSGWRLTIDSALPDEKAAVVLLGYNTRTANNTLDKKTTKGWISLGAGYADALKILAEEQVMRDMEEAAKEKGG